VKRRRTALRAAAAALMAVLAGCASAPVAPTLPGADTAWTTGRMSVRVDASPAGVAQNLSAAFELRGDGNTGELRLVSALGTSLAHARWTPGQARLETAEGERSFENLDELSRQALGEALPLAALPDWLAGRAWPGAAHVDAADGFEQLGWQVQLARRTEGFIEARRATAPAVLLRIKLDAPA
jgi:outer membrane lipoprotein LolB